MRFFVFFAGEEWHFGAPFQPCVRRNPEKNTRCFRCAKLDFLNVQIQIMLECVVLSKLRLRHLISSAYLGV